MCCVCNLLCKLISLAISILFIVAVILLILWATRVIFVSDATETSSPLGGSYANHHKLI